MTENNKSKVSEEPQPSLNAVEEAISDAIKTVTGSEDPKLQENTENKINAAVDHTLDNNEANNEANTSLDEERKESQAKYMRLAADFDNFRKRSEREKSELRKYAAEKFVREILAPFDNLNRAITHAKDDDSPLAEGIRMVVKQIDEVLTRNGVESVKTLGGVFTPESQEALTQIPSEEPAGVVVEEIEKGYMLHDRLIRAAKVIVSMGPAKEDH